MTPSLRDWLAAYADAAEQHEEDTARAFPMVPELVSTMPLRPLAMQFTIHASGELYDWRDVYLGNAAELSPTDRRMLGLNPDWNPMPRRNPDTLNAVTQTAAPAGMAHIITETATVPLTLGSPPPASARPGDVITMDGDPAGVLGLDGSGNAVMLANSRTRALFTQEFGPAPAQHQPAGHGPAAQAINLSRIDLGRTPDGAIIPLPEELQPAAPSIISAVNDGLARVNTSTAAMRAALTDVGATISATMADAMTPRPEEQEVYEGPRMLATIAHNRGAAARFIQHTMDAEAAHLRAGQVYHQATIYGTAIRRAVAEAPTATMVDRNAAAVDRFLNRGFGLELNDDALTAVTAMVNVLVRQATIPATARAERAETTAAEERHINDRHRATISTLQETIITSTDPGPVEAAAAAARVWKETPLTDSVAKRDSFLALLATLDRLAQ